jgi:preprotein translocase subunit YajC
MGHLLLAFVWLVAQGDAAGAAPAGAGGGDGGTSFLVQFFPIIAMVMLFWFFFLLPQQKEQQQRLQMLNGLKKNDRVVTMAGLIGTIANFSADGKEVTLKVDDDVRLRFQRDSIKSVLSGEPSETVPPPAAPKS